MESRGCAVRLRGVMEGGFEALARVLCRRPWVAIGLAALVLAGLASGLGRLRLDTTPEGMLRPDDPVRLAYDAFRQDFGHDGVILVGIPVQGAFDGHFLSRLVALHRDLEGGLPHVRDVTSLVDARYTRGEEDVFVVGDLLEAWQARGGDPVSLLRFATGHPLYRDNLVSASGGLVALVVEIEAEPETGVAAGEDLLAGFDASVAAGPPRSRLTGAQSAEAVAAVRRVVEAHRAEGFEPMLTGRPVLVDGFDRATLDDSALCTSASLVAILALLGFFFRRVSGVLLPALVVSASLAASLGLMGLLGAPYTLSTTGIVPILIAVGICSAVHLLAIFYRALARLDDKRSCIVHALGHAGPAIALTSLTTAAGLLSFALADLASTADVGRYASVGVLLCLGLTVLVLPAILAVVPIRRVGASPAESAAADRVLVGLARLATRRHGPILAVSLAVLVVGAYGATQLRFSHDPVAYFDGSVPLRRDLAQIDRELRGGTTLEVVVDSGREDGLYEPALLGSLDRISRTLRDRRPDRLPVSQIFSVNDVVKETHQALHANDPSYYRIPADRQLLSQELFLFENSGSDDLERLVDPGFQRARFSIKTPHADAVDYVGFVEEVRSIFGAELGGAARVSLTGGMALEAQAVPRALAAMSESYVSAFVVISLLMVVFLGSVRLGLAAMLPNLLPVLATMGGMGLLQIPIDLTTITVGSIGLGLVVDDTIHFMYNFQKYHERESDVTRAVEAAFLGAGRAMLITSIVLVACFGVDLMASLANVVRFGTSVATIVVLALAADFLVAPALMQALDRRGWLAAPARGPTAAHPGPDVAQLPAS